MKRSLTRFFDAFGLSPRRVLLGTLCALVPVAVSPAVAQSQPNSPAGRFALLIDGESAGFLRKVSGGTIKADVATVHLGPENIVKKHIAAITHESFTIDIGMGMGKGIYDWIQASFDKGFVRRSGEVVAADFDYGAQNHREFFDAVITEVKFPALDAGSKEPAFMTVELAPEEIVYKPGDSIRTNPGDRRGDRRKKWLASNFRFELGDLPTERVAKIDSLTWTQSIVEGALGEDRLPELAPGTVEVSNLKVTISMADVRPWQGWFKTFVIDGENADADELDGSIAFLGPDKTEELGRIDLFNVGIIALETASAEANKEQVARFTVELYAEGMTFEHTANGDDSDNGDGQNDDAGR